MRGPLLVGSFKGNPKGSPTHFGDPVVHSDPSSEFAAELQDLLALLLRGDLSAWQWQAGGANPEKKKTPLGCGCQKMVPKMEPETLQLGCGCQKQGNPKMGCPGKWKHGLKPAVPCWIKFDPYPLG